jgi:hypothetical protein
VFKYSVHLGGILRGKALGNTFNFGDEEHSTFNPVATPMKGVVYLYVSQVNPANLGLKDMTPMAQVKVAIENSMTPILQAVARKYQPISGMCIIKCTVTT